MIGPADYTFQQVPMPWRWRGQAHEDPTHLRSRGRFGDVDRRMRTRSAGLITEYTPLYYCITTSESFIRSALLLKFSRSSRRFSVALEFNIE
jgi:hypothetical protein